ncbi:putative ribosomal protein L22/L17 [Helianthus annuus]|uniref:Ribosomal protein L22/L17 n=2 Tax=Helianthus annuus TaxID=4232 RepID=A0A9K3EGP5_HELAN|nr:putative ribosomal protein L22/L17 [Helianthus annuus]KAJ0481241.1 putative ribosomal protein L22/L17 [Helianthus annuus]KAJ0497718.1 putative ribosomal protein L22/L17 [Helianthus annuus]KAJ0663723.1 putative ribosomal protein L22/L17 [Helianthus annuus]KAJ0849225.1 putative ribosomal protein L22/L17 [Helianthus annuus]
MSYLRKLQHLKKAYNKDCMLSHFNLVYSAAANASSNMGSNEAKLVISKAEINKGTIMKRLKPRARGRSFAIQKPTCHITIVMKDISLYEYIDTASITWSQTGCLPIEQTSAKGNETGGRNDMRERTSWWSPVHRRLLEGLLFDRLVISESDSVLDDGLLIF